MSIVMVEVAIGVTLQTPKIFATDQIEIHVFENILCLLILQHAFQLISGVRCHCC